MTTMPATHGHSVACCNVPPVSSEGYQYKGTFEEYGGKKTYTTGPADATKGVVHVFDIFGYKDQTVQGADIIATSDSQNKYKVFMPDWFDGEPADLALFPPDTPEKQQKLGAFFQKNSPPSVAVQIPGYVATLKEKFPSITSWYLIGFCWGGKVVSLTTAVDNPFTVAAEIHPAMVDPNDAAGIKTPLVMLPSKDENADDVAKFEKNLTVPHYFETFPDQIHGWMGARSDLKDEHVKAEYIRGYKTLLEQFAKLSSSAKL